MFARVCEEQTNGFWLEKYLNCCVKIDTSELCLWCDRLALISVYISFGRSGPNVTQRWLWMGIFRRMDFWWVFRLFLGRRISQAIVVSFHASCQDGCRIWTDCRSCLSSEIFKFYLIHVVNNCSLMDLWKNRRKCFLVLIVLTNWLISHLHHLTFLSFVLAPKTIK